MVDKYIYSENNGLWYELQGNCYIPCLKLPKEEPAHIGIWGQRHLWYLKHYHKVRYYNLLTNGKLNDYLADICNQAEKLFFRLVKQMEKAEGINEQLKAADFMAWVSKMNNIRNRATEIVNSEIIYI